MDVIFKEGMVYLQEVKSGKVFWKKMWATLFEPSLGGIGRVELYGLHNTNGKPSYRVKPPLQKRPDWMMVHLCDCLSITPAQGEPCPSGCKAFYLHTTQCLCTLASETCDDWLSAFHQLAFQKDPGETVTEAPIRGTMEDNDLYSSWNPGVDAFQERYQVTVQDTEASVRCRVAGDYFLSLCRDAVWLLDLQNAHTVYHWPYKFLRRFGKIEGGIIIEVGRRCDSGEGVFQFLSSRSLEIYQTLAKECSLNRRKNPSATQSASACKDPLTDTYSEIPRVQPPTKTNSLPRSLASQPPNLPAATATEPAYEVYSIISHKTSSLSRHTATHSTQRPHPTCSPKRKESEREDEKSGHLFSQTSDPDDVEEEVVYSNVRHVIGPGAKNKALSEDSPPSSECIYSDVIIPGPLLARTPPPVTHPKPHVQSYPCLQPKPQHPPQPLPQVKTQVKPRYWPSPRLLNPSTGVSRPPKREEIISDGEPKPHALSFNPTGARVSFKLKLAEIISKDLAKPQPAFPSGDGHSTPFSSF